MEKGENLTLPVGGFKNEQPYDDTAATKSERPCCCISERSERNIFNGVIVPILLGQLLALMIAVTAASSGLLAKQKITLPISQNMPHYFLLFICYGGYKLFRYVKRLQVTKERPNSQAEPLKDPTDGRGWFKYYGLYVFTGLIDVHANWALVSAYAYTSVTSVQLLDCITIPTAMAVSCLVLRHRYSWIHYLSTLICLAAAGGMITVDVLSPHQTGNNTDGLNDTTTVQPSNPALGDILVVLGAIGYAVSNVLQQYLVIKYSFVDFIVYTGFTAFISTFVYSIVLERKGLSQLFYAHTGSKGVISGYFVSYSTAMFALYSIMPYALARTGAVFVNLSLLTADVYALLMGIYLFKNHFNGFYLLCFAFILFGVILFALRKPRINPTHYSWCPGWLVTQDQHQEEVTELDQGQVHRVYSGGNSRNLLVHPS